MTAGLRVAVVGATGAVGREMLRCLYRRSFPVAEVVALASSRGAGGAVSFGDDSVPVRLLGPDSFRGVDLALFSAGGDVSREYAPRAVAAGAVVVDNSSAWRMDPEVPLIVPEVNAAALAGHSGIVANPNCSTIQLVVALAPLHTRAGLRRVVVSTYQSASGAGQRAVDELLAQTSAALDPERPPLPPDIHPKTLAFNCVPQVDAFLDDGVTKEERKMVLETRKILGVPSLRVHATCVRVPVDRGHSESVNVEMERALSPEEARSILDDAPGVEVLDDPGSGVYPTPLETAGTDAIYVGRIRRDDTVEHGLAFWVVADNLLKGAALNSVQIAEALLGPQ